MTVQRPAVSVDADELDELRRDAELLRVLCDNWGAYYEGKRVVDWINDNALRIGGYRAAIKHLSDIAAEYRKRL